MGYEISHNLYSIYTYVNRQLTASIIKRKPVNIDSVKENMEKLRKSFEEVAKQDTSGSVVQNSQKYMPDSLTEKERSMKCLWIMRRQEGLRLKGYGVINGRRSLYIFYAQTRFRSDNIVAAHK